MQKNVSILKIKQLDNFSFQIDWNDGTSTLHKLSDLQKNCPCANCVDETSGRRLNQVQSVKEDVRAVNIQNVGRYALKIDFTSGCSTGIYSFNMLHQGSQNIGVK